MAKTGIGLLDILALVATLLPLIPVFIIFISKAYKTDTLALLMGLCLVSFIGHLILYIPKFVSIDTTFISASFGLVNYIILFLLLQLVIGGRFLKEFLKMMLISFISVVVTIYSTAGIPAHYASIQFVQSLIMIPLTVIALFQLIKRHDVFIFLSPMFWVASGTFFFYSMFLLTQSIPDYKGVIPNTPEHEKKVLLLVIVFIQFIFYIIAAVVAARGGKQQEVIPD